MNTYYYCLLSEVKPEHYPMIFEVAGEVLNESTIINLERRLSFARKYVPWYFFFITPHKDKTYASHWNFGAKNYVKKTNAVYLFNPSLSVEEVLFLHSLETQMKQVRYFVHASEFTQEVYDKMTAMVGKLDYSFERLDQKLQEGYATNLNSKRSLLSDYALIRPYTGLINPDFCSYRHIEHYLDSYDWINLGVSGHSAAEHLFIRQLEE